MPEDTPEIIAEQSKIRFPSHWKKPKYQLGQLVKRAESLSRGSCISGLFKTGRIIGIEYQPPGTRRAFDLGAGWLYSVLLDDLGYDTENLKESEIEPSSLKDLQAKIEYEKSLLLIHQKNLATLMEQLEAQNGAKQRS